MTVGCLNSGVETSKGAGNVLYLEVHKRENSKKIRTYLYIHGSDAAEEGMCVNFWILSIYVIEHGWLGINYPPQLFRPLALAACYCRP
ncbi:hypothetical protein L3X38_026460 [Prunus dulcis]|uniref:Uncharacterized protein n=1 Tax=Prunus dulcis TaxID=3755 RepID=A0AAD4VMK5_PRUDU|nr:hypothetical protein L3X38_026460 [Prunus dulcis]